MTIQVLKEELLKLSKAQQIEVMHFMVEVIASDDFELSEEWKAELDKREEALEKGNSVGRSAKDVISKYTTH